MTTILMCACGANDAVIGGRCAPCHTDHVAAPRAAQKAMDQARIEARRRGRPSWRPEPQRGHGIGRGRACGGEPQ
jgi:hypothetical protein